MQTNISFCGVDFPNPLVLASGVLGISGTYMGNINGLGGVTTKSVWTHRHEGHKNPVIIAEKEYMMNAVGLPDAGIEKAREEVAAYRIETKNPIIINIAGGSVQEFAEGAAAVAKLNPDLIEVNISCPNVKNEFGELFGGGTKTAEEITKAVKKEAGGIPISVKLSPNVENIGDVAKAVEACGADAITAINTVGPGLRIDPRIRKPILANGFGGVSGPAIFPIAIAKVWEISKAVSLPIIGTGGVNSGADVIEMMLAGASLVGIGSADHFRGPNAFETIYQEMLTFCEEEGIENLEEIIGKGQGEGWVERKCFV